MRASRVFRMVLLLAAHVAIADTSFAGRYSIRKMEPLPGRAHDSSFASAIDDAGNIVGYSYSASHATTRIGTVLLHTGERLSMGAIADCTPHGESILIGVSPNGRTAGYASAVCGGYTRSTTSLVATPATFIAFSPLPSGGDCQGNDANDSNMIVGWSNVTTGCLSPLCIATTARPMCWTFGGAAKQLSLGINPVGFAFGTNAAGVVVGQSLLGNPLSYERGVPVVWASTSALPVTLPAISGTFGVAYKISDSSTIVGQSEAGEFRHATKWNGNVATDLGVLPGCSISSANDVDDRFGAVGFSQGSGAMSARATLFRDGEVVDLNALLLDAAGVVFTSAEGINRNGWIAANGSANGKSVGYVLVPCFADMNDDGVVDDADFSMFVVAYDLLDCADPAMPARCPADLNKDGAVDDADFTSFVVAYEEVVCP